MNSSFAQAVYFAPRGKQRLMELGNQISQKYLSPTDKLIALIGDSGAGKSLLIRGMFPGLTLTNDDNGINVRPLPILDQVQEEDFKSHTYHVDARFETAFNQPWEVAKAIRTAIANDKRVVIEHFDLLAGHIDLRADLLIGVGEEVMITKPGVFGPKVNEIKEIVFNSLLDRLMAHTAEDLTTYILETMDIKRPAPYYHSDIKSGFVLQFKKKPEVEIEAVESKVNELIKQDLSVKPYDEEHIKFGDVIYLCNGPRIHVKSTAKIKNFKLHQLKYDSKDDFYLLAGVAGKERSQFALSQV